MHVRSCCFAYKTYCFFDVLVAVASLDRKVPVVIKKHPPAYDSCKVQKFFTLICSATRIAYGKLRGSLLMERLRVTFTANGKRQTS